MIDWIRESNLIEGIDDPKEDERCENAWFLALKHHRLGHQLIQDTHYYIMRVLRGDIAGQYRKCDVTVGGRVCPKWRSVPYRLNKWIEDYAAARTEEHIREAHIQFEYIHPFEDGNGRTGRMIMNWQRAVVLLLPLCIKAAERQEYYKWFKKTGKLGGTP